MNRREKKNKVTKINKKNMFFILRNVTQYYIIKSSNRNHISEGYTLMIPNVPWKKIIRRD